jgi:TM2 domain-containing membrane protein YozV
VERSFAQQKADSVSLGKDTIPMPPITSSVNEVRNNPIVDSTPFVTPKKAALFSAIVPGLGQFYNKQYWKIPVIYGLVGVSIYFLNDNIKNYNAFRKEYAGRKNNAPGFVSKFPEYKDDNTIKDAQDYYRKNIDLTGLLTALGFTLQVMDAVVFAHLKNFDISEDISLNLQPVLTPQGGAGLGLVMKF